MCCRRRSDEVSLDARRRVKTLHPAIQGGILARRGHETDQKEVLEYGLSLIDLVIVDLYPFEATVASGASEEDIIEKIDIGGISLIRGAAKNFGGRRHHPFAGRLRYTA